MSVIEADSLEKSYGDVRAVDGLSLGVDRGELYGFLGPNGAGKTTTIEILTGQTRPDAGRVRVLDTDPVADAVETRRRVGVLPEQQTPPSFLSPGEFFEFVGRVRGLDDGVVGERVETWADRLGFAEKLETLCGDLSRGQQQKVMLTQAFLHEPDVVVIDEPLANLDPIVQEQVKDHLRSYAADGNAVFVSTHNIEVAADVCTRVGIVSNGRVVAERDVDTDTDALLDVFLEEVGSSSPRDTPKPAASGGD
ncbi:ABC transporter ATP-binding protein [Halobacterium zhouii]|uniref:ABC transporter ATP-binding protein n=1 Tax=Halobacterium zhouii TaxID=2902624 RepID=UPI001E6032C9|nr:ABC transporter ATP-binding protein [Halobacterium zhouii]